jgi:hypothetical protein
MADAKNPPKGATTEAKNPKMVYHYNLLSSLEKEQFLEAIVPTNDPELLQRFQEYALSTIR